METITQDEVYASLKTVLDPELHINIVDLGLVYDVTIKDERKIHILMTLTTPGCPLGAMIVRMIRDSLAHIEGMNP